jgi:hypothetical protein
MPACTPQTPKIFREDDFSVGRLKGCRRAESFQTIAFYEESGSMSMGRSKRQRLRFVKAVESESATKVSAKD